MATRKCYDLSQEQLALAKERKEKRMNKVLVTKDIGTPQLLTRRWLSLPHALNLEHPGKSRYHQVKIMTWNVCRLLLPTCILFYWILAVNKLLAQCLISMRLNPAWYHVKLSNNSDRKRIISNEWLLESRSKRAHDPWRDFATGRWHRLSPSRFWKPIAGRGNDFMYLGSWPSR